MTFLAFWLLGASGGFSEIYTLKISPDSQKNIMSYSLVNKLWTKDSLRKFGSETPNIPALYNHRPLSEYLCGIFDRGVASFPGHFHSQGWCGFLHGNRAFLSFVADVAVIRYGVACVSVRYIDAVSMVARRGRQIP